MEEAQGRPDNRTHIKQKVYRNNSLKGAKFGNHHGLT